MLYRERIFGVLAKIETTSGTDAVPTAGSNGVRVVGIPTLEVDYLESGARDDVITGQLGRASRAGPAARFGRITLVLEAKGAGAAYSASVVPEADVFHRMSGFGRTIVTTGGSESVLYTTLDGSMETATIYCYSGGKLYKLVGCTAQPTFTNEVLAVGRQAFAVMGMLAADPTEVALPAITVSSVIPPGFHSAANNIGTWTSATVGDPLVLLSANVDTNTVISDRPSAGATDGLIGFGITDRNTVLTLEFEPPQIATSDFFALSKATEATATMPQVNWQLGTVQYNRVKYQTGRWLPNAPRQGARNGKVTWTVSGGLAIGLAPTSARELNILYD